MPKKGNYHIAIGAKSATLLRMKRLLPLWLLLLLTGCAGEVALPSATASPAPAAGLYFPETGHSVQPPFREGFFRRGGLPRLGYPITEAMTHEGWRVQYFQYGRLEAHPENPPAYFITVGWLGQLSHRTQPPLPVLPASAGRVFPETGHTLSGDFLAYFESRGDTVVFGLPISEPFLQNGLLAQDLQSARFLWRPDLPPAARVQLEPLGENYFLASDLPLSLLEPVPPPPHAEIHAAPDAPLPAGVIAALRVEPTPRDGVVRVIAILLRNGEPVIGYAPRLRWGAETRLLPPTQSAGETHTRVFPVTPGATLTLLDNAGQSALATVTLSSSLALPPGESFR